MLIRILRICYLLNATTVSEKELLKVGDRDCKTAETKILNILRQLVKNNVMYINAKFQKKGIAVRTRNPQTSKPVY